MGLLSNEISRDKLKPGDHIYSWRNKTTMIPYVYAHHGIYISEEKVIQLTSGQESSTRTFSGPIISSSPSSSTIGNRCPKCGYQPGLSDGVVSSCVDCFLDGGDLCLFEYHVSIPYFLATIRGTCTLARSDSPEVVIRRASYLLDHRFRDYSLLQYNCEDFAIYCKTGLIVIPDSGATMNRVGRSIASYLVTGASYWVTGFIGMPFIYCTRLLSDIKMRSNSKKISVEELVSKYGS